MMRARGAMTRHVQTIGPESSVFEALTVMRDSKVRHLPVVDGEEALVGIVSEGDLLSQGNHKGHDMAIPTRYCVADVMTKPVITCSPEASVADVAATMITCKIDCLPVVTEGRLIGILSTTDILELYCVDQELNGHAVMPLSFSDHGRRKTVDQH